MLLDTGRDCENVRVENDVCGIDANLLCQYLVRAFANRHLAPHRVCLAGLVESHDDDGSAVAADEFRLLDESIFAFLQTDRVDDRLALHATQTCLDHGPFRRVDHDRQTRNVGLGCDQFQERHHGLLRVEHAFVHVDVDDLCAILHLLSRYLHGRRVIVCLDQAPEDCGARDVAALADIDEQIVRADVQGLEPRQAAADGQVRHAARRRGANRFPECSDVLGTCAATASDHVDQATGCEFADDPGHVLGCFVVLAELVRQAGIRVRADASVGDARKLVDIRPQVFRAQRAVQSDHERIDVTYRVPERLGGLAR